MVQTKEGREQGNKMHETNKKENRKAIKQIMTICKQEKRKQASINEDFKKYKVALQAHKLQQSFQLQKQERKLGKCTNSSKKATKQAC